MEVKKKFKPNPKLKLMEQVREVMRYHHYAYRTEQTYSDWILRYVKFHGSKKHPRNMGKKEIEAFLSHLAIKSPSQGKSSKNYDGVGMPSQIAKKYENSTKEFSWQAM